MEDSLDTYGASDELINYCELCYESSRKYEEPVAVCRDCRKSFCKHCYDGHRFVNTPQWEKSSECQLFRYIGCKKHYRQVTDKFCCEHCDIICKKCCHDDHPRCHVRPLSSIDSWECHKIRGKRDEILVDFHAAKAQKVNDIEVQRKAALKEISTSYKDIRKKLKRSQQEVNQVYTDQINKLQFMLDNDDQDLQTLDKTLLDIERKSKIGVRQNKNLWRILADAFQRIKLKSKAIHDPTKALSIPDSWTKLGEYAELLFSENRTSGNNDMQPCIQPSKEISNELSKSERSVSLSMEGNADFDKQDTNKHPNVHRKLLMRQASVLDTRLSKLNMLPVKTDLDKDDCCITGMCITRDGCILMADCYNKTVKLFSQLGKHLSSCVLPGEPWDIALTRNNEVAVTLWDNQKSIELLSFTRSSLQLETSIRLKNRVYGIAAVEDQICVTCDDNIPSVKLINRDGSIQWSLAFDSRGNKLFKTPGYIISGLKEEKSCVLVTDKERHTITVIDARSGEINNVFSLSKTGPNGFSFDSVGNIFVGYCYSEGVCIYSADMNDYKLLLSSADKIKRPQAVVFNSLTNELLFSSWRSNTVERFKVL